VFGSCGNHSPFPEEDLMRKTVAAIAAAGSLLAGLAMATPALARSSPITLLCSPGSNGGTLVGGVCVLPAAVVGQPYEAFLLTSNGAVDTFTITSGGVPPGLSMPATYGAAGTIVGGTPTEAGTFTFTVRVTKFGTSTPATSGTYSITVGAPPPLAITFPATCCNAGTVGSSYFQNFFSSGGVGPFTWTVTAGQLPPGVALTGGNLGGTPATAGTFAFTVKVTDSVGDQATESGSITISP
jgi:large repetitive protein